MGILMTAKNDALAPHFADLEQQHEAATLGMWIFLATELMFFGGLTGLFLAALGLDVHVYDTYFVIAHFHFIMVGGMVMAYMGGLHYWWPKITGRLYSELWGKLAALIIFVGFIEARSEAGNAGLFCVINVT